MNIPAQRIAYPAVSFGAQARALQPILARNSDEECVIIVDPRAVMSYMQACADGGKDGLLKAEQIADAYGQEPLVTIGRKRVIICDPNRLAQYKAATKSGNQALAARLLEVHGTVVVLNKHCG